jgi:hypothetical protein
MVREGIGGHVVGERKRRTMVIGWKVDTDEEFSASASVIEFVNHRVERVDGEEFGVNDLLLSDPALDEPWRFDGIHVEAVRETHSDRVGGSGGNTLWSDRETIHQRSRIIETE